MARVLAISSDLLLGSKVEAMLRAASHEVTMAPSPDSSHLEGADLIVADLDAVDAPALVDHGIPVLGYYSHVDVETKQRAEAAGVDLVIPRSRMSRELPKLVTKLLA